MVAWTEDGIRQASVALCGRLGIPGGSDDTRHRLGEYVSLLARFGAHTDLVGARSSQAIAELALGDALVLAHRPELLLSPSWEIGAGGASILVPLALILPDLTGVLVEPRQKRAVFLRVCLGAFALTSRLSVRQERIEPGSAPIAVAGSALARAVYAPEEWLPLAARLIRPNGTIVVFGTAPLDAPSGYRRLATETYRLEHARTARTLTWLTSEAPVAP